MDNEDSGLQSVITEPEMQQHQDEAATLTSRNSNVAVVYARLPLPPIASSNIESWFTTMDFWFSASGITADKQKMATVLAAMDPNVISQLTDVIADMPSSDRYEFIKTKIIAHFADSEQRRLNRLLSELPLGDKKPSELYYEMKRVAGSTLGEAALKGLWIKRLPDVIQPVVAASTAAAAEFTKIADSIVDAISPGHVNAISKCSRDDIDKLKSAVSDLTKEIEKMKIRSRSRSRHDKGRGVSRSRTRFSQPRNETLSGAGTVTDECWYHKRYGRNARKCRSPCRHNHLNSVSSEAAVTCL